MQSLLPNTVPLLTSEEGDDLLFGNLVWGEFGYGVLQEPILNEGDSNSIIGDENTDLGNLVYGDSSLVGIAARIIHNTEIATIILPFSSNIGNVGFHLGNIALGYTNLTGVSGEIVSESNTVRVFRTIRYNVLAPTLIGARLTTYPNSSIIKIEPSAYNSFNALSVLKKINTNATISSVSTAILIKNNPSQARVTTERLDVLFYNDDPNVLVTKEDVGIVYTSNSPNLRVSNNEFQIVLNSNQPNTYVSSNSLQIVIKPANLITVSNNWIIRFDTKKTTNRIRQIIYNVDSDIQYIQVGKQASVNYNVRIFRYIQREILFTVTQIKTISIRYNVQNLLPKSNKIVVWYKGDVNTTTDDLDGLENWGDNSGNNRFAFQDNSFSKPKLIPNILNGHPVVRFDGQSDNLEINDSRAMIDSSDTATFIVVMKDSSIATTERQIISNSSQFIGNTYYYFGVTGSPDKGVLTSHFGGVNDFDGQIGRGNIPHNEYVIYTGIINPKPSIIVNWDEVATSDNGIPSKSANFTYYLGKRGEIENNYFEGDIAEIIVWKEALPQTELIQSINYLNYKYFNKVPVNLIRGISYNCISSPKVSISAELEWKVDHLPFVSVTTYWNSEIGPFYPVSQIGQIRFNDLKLVNQDIDFSYNLEELPKANITTEIIYNLDERPKAGIVREIEFNIRKLANRPRTIRFNTRIIRRRTRTILWKIRQKTGEVKNTNWRVRKLVSKQNQVNYNVKQTIVVEVFKQPITRFRYQVRRNTDDVVNLQQYFESNIRKTVSKTIPINFNTKQLSTKSHNISYNVIAVSKIFGNINFNTRKLVRFTRFLQFIVLKNSKFAFAGYNVLKRVTKTITSKWRVISYNNTTGVMNWNMTFPTNKEFTLSFANRVLVPKMTSTFWNLEGVATKVIQTNWNIERSKGLRFSIYWDVRPQNECSLEIPTTPTGISFRVLYRVATQRVSTSILFGYCVMRNSTKIRSFDWNNHIKLSTTKQIKYNTFYRTTKINPQILFNNNDIINKNIFINYNTNVKINKSIVASWNNNILVSDNFNILYNNVIPFKYELFFNTKVRVNKQIAILHNVYNKKYFTNEVLYNNRNIATLSAQIKYNITTSKSFSINWNTKIFQYKDFQVIFNTRISQEITINFSHNIKSLASKQGIIRYNYSTVGIRTGIGFNTRKRISRELGIPILWNVYNTCVSEFIKSEDALYKGLVVKLTVCEVNRDRKQVNIPNRYVSRYD